MEKDIEKSNEEPKEQVEEPQKLIESDLIVEQLPTVPTRKVVGENGQVYNLITRDEALLECVQSLRELKKAIVG